MRIGVCSWSLQPTGPDDLADKCARLATDLSQRWGVQLALDPLRAGWGVGGTVTALRDVGVDVISGMMAMRGEDYSTLASIRQTGGVRLDEYWAANLAAAGENAAIARELGISLVTFHAGFITHDCHDPTHDLMIDRLRQLADCFAEQGVRVALETGQETGETLLAALSVLNRASVGVNFDPGNMILYGMGDPVAALRALAPRVVQVHIKDAVPTDVAGEWGAEVPAGDGDVDWAMFFATYRETGLSCDLVIEREAGNDRVHDVRVARALLDLHLAT